MKLFPNVAALFVDIHSRPCYRLYFPALQVIDVCGLVHVAYVWCLYAGGSVCSPLRCEPFDFVMEIGLDLSGLVHLVVRAVAGPAGIVALGSCGDSGGKLVDVLIDSGKRITVEVTEDIFYSFLETRKLIDVINEEALELWPVPDKGVPVVVVCIAEIPYRSCYPFGIGAPVFMKIETASSSCMSSRTT